MKTLLDLRAALAAHPDFHVALRLPDGGSVPAHFHITEVGHVVKRFVDCGGSMHHHESCLLQAWVAGDVEHRLTAGKLAGIVAHFEKFGVGEALPVELEYEEDFLSQYTLVEIEACCGTVTLGFAAKHTDCLAKDACGIPAAGEETASCCGGTGCC